MKRIFLLCFLCLFSCTLDDVNPERISGEQVVRDEKTAQALLNGAYKSLRVRNSVQFLSKYTLALSIYSPYERSSAGVYALGLLNYGINNVTPSSSSAGILETFYINMYYVIDICNVLIEKLSHNGGKKYNISQKRQDEILGEARGMRALCHFSLLKTFGQFYDENSPYGIVIADRPMKANTRKSRQTVARVYDFISEDLTFAMKKAPLRKDKRVYMTQTVATALLSKLFLYRKDYAKAAAFAKSVIENTDDNYALYTDYSTVFLKRWESPEVLFALYADGVRETSVSSYYLGNLGYASPSALYLSIPGIREDKRFTFLYKSKVGASLGLSNKYPFSSHSSVGNGNTYYFMRMSEVYLICAEANARQNLPQEALSYLNKVRKQAGAPPKVFSDVEKLLKDIREEKVIELTAENAEPWFDAVRYDRLGNLVLGALKPTLAKNKDAKTKETNADKLIFPLPEQVRNGNKNLVQNPGY